MTVHISRPHERTTGTWLCGAAVRSGHEAFVHHLAPAHRFREVGCAQCLILQICDCHDRALRAAVDTSVQCEREAEQVCRIALSALRAREAS